MRIRVLSATGLAIGLLCSSLPAVDQFNKYTSAGNIGLTITNFGVLGQGYNIEGQPSCLYRQYSQLEFEQIEHFSYGGLWVGGVVEGQPYVSTGVIDGTFGGGEGWEWNNTWPTGESPAADAAAIADTIDVRSSLPLERNYHPQAVSHEDFHCVFTDTSTVVPETEPPRLIDNHVPMGLEVRLDSRAWNYSYADGFVIFDLTIRNISAFQDPAGVGHAIDSVYVGFWIDEAVGNFNLHDYYAPGNGGWSWYDNLSGVVATNGYTPAEGDTINMAVGYDADGDDGFSHSMLGCRFLGGTSPTISDPRRILPHANAWQWNTPVSQEFPALGMPGSDIGRYNRMTYTPDLGSAGFPYGSEDAASWMMLSSAGSFGSLQPGESLNAVFAIACARWKELTPAELSSTPQEQLQYRAGNLIASTDWAQIAWRGEDRNGNGVLDPGEDLIENGVLDRYLLPQPPPGPRTHLVVEDRALTLYWDESPELFVDPIIGEADFEGYRVYGSPRTAGSEEDKTLLLEVDLVNDLWPNTGLSSVRLEEPAWFEDPQSGDSVAFHYSLHLDRLRNGLPSGNWLAVSAFDRGDPDNNLASLESSYTENQLFYFPGATPDDPSLSGLPDRQPGVYPNPYRGRAAWDGSGDRDRLLWFTNLPSRCEIRIFTLAGDLIDVLEHDAATYRGGDVKRITEAREQAGEGAIFSGGEHAWDLISRSDQAIATGLYLFTVEDRATGRVERGKFAVIK